MPDGDRSAGLFRFGVFEADLHSCELQRNGRKVSLQGQPFQVLAILLQQSGELVTREELRQKVWPADTFVDFDHGLNTAITKIRTALGDSAENPRFVETLARRGYRFIAPVENQGAKVGERVGTLPLTSERTVHFSLTKRLVLLFSLLGLLVLAAVVLWLNRWSRLSIPAVVDSFQITKDERGKEFFAVRPLRLLSDGSRLYFTESLPEGAALMQVSTQGGETARIPVTLEDPEVYDISPIHSELLVAAGASKGEDRERPLWIVPLPAGSPHRIGDILAHDACWAPDGHHLVFINDKDLFIAKPDGSEVRKLTSATSSATGIRFSPDGKRLRFTVHGPRAQVADFDIMEVAADGTGLHRLPIHGLGGDWSANGKYYFYATDRDIWVLPEQRSIFSGVQLGTPVQVTAGPLVFRAPLPSTDGKQLFVLGTQRRVQLVHYDNRLQRLTPFLGGISAGELEVSPDGQWVTYTTYPESTLWRSKLDGSERMQLTFAPIHAHEPRWSPDGKQILFADFPFKIYVVSADGGSPRQLMPEDHPNLAGAGAWLPDGNSIIFVRVMGCTFFDEPCFRQAAAIYRLDLKTQQISKLPDSDGMFATRLSRDGRYLTALRADRNTVMLYNLQTERWSELVQGYGSIVWSRDSKSVYLIRRGEAQTAELDRISVPAGKTERVLNLKDVILGSGNFSDWVSLLPDGSPLLMLDKSTQELYRLDLQYR